MPEKYKENQDPMMNWKIVGKKKKCFKKRQTISKPMKGQVRRGK